MNTLYFFLLKEDHPLRLTKPKKKQHKFHSQNMIKSLVNFIMNPGRENQHAPQTICEGSGVLRINLVR